MNMSGNEARGGEDPVEAILKKAGRRLAPPIEDEREIREAVRGEWLALIDQRRMRQRGMGFAVAAILIVAATALFTMLPQDRADPYPIASIDKSAGTIYLLVENSALVELPGAATVYAGQVIQTGPDGSLGLGWGRGGSLRIDRDTRIEFIDRDTVFLHRGRVYFDSRAGTGSSRLAMDTELGSVAHLGTQYMASVDMQELVVSVREGRVHVDGRYHARTAEAGKQVRLRGTARPVVVDLPSHGEPWSWTEALSPGIDLDNRSAYEFLEWVGRETGHKVVFESADAERLATHTLLVGSVEADPRTELRLRMMTTDLEYAFDSGEGTIHIRMATGGGN